MADTNSRVVLADRRHRFSGYPVADLFVALTSGRMEWVRLEPREVMPEVLEAVPNERVVWSSFWPVSPDDIIELELSSRFDGSELHSRWLSASPPDERGIAITRQRLNRRFGSDLRGVVAASSWSR